MKKKDVYRLRSIIQQIRTIDQNDRDPMQKDKKTPLYEEGIRICNEDIDKKNPL